MISQISFFIISKITFIYKTFKNITAFFIVLSKKENLTFSNN